MRVLSVDLAAKFSAAMVVDEHSGVHWEADSSQHTAAGWCRAIREAAIEHQPNVIMVEDVPYGITQQGMVKPVLRLQGMLLYCLRGYSPLWINPNTWQKDYPGVTWRKGVTEQERLDNMAKAAAELGYAPPPLVERYLASLPPGQKPLVKHTKPLAKSMTDYIAARLIADWTIKNFDRLWDTSGVQVAYI